MIRQLVSQGLNRNDYQLNKIVLKGDFRFVTFDNVQDAEEAVHNLNGQKLLGI